MAWVDFRTHADSPQTRPLKPNQFPPQDEPVCRDTAIVLASLSLVYLSRERKQLSSCFMVSTMTDPHSTNLLTNSRKSVARSSHRQRHFVVSTGAMETLRQKHTPGMTTTPNEMEKTDTTSSIAGTYNKSVTTYSILSRDITLLGQHSS